MAGLQQYNFFPTDLFYPRPKPQPSPSNPTLLPLQNPNNEDNKNQQQQPPRSMVKATPSTSPLVYTHNKSQESLSGVDNKVSKFSTNPLSWVVFMDQEEG